MRIRIEGGRPLNGTYTPSGNPNAAKALLAASMLSGGPTSLSNVPRNTSTQNMFQAAQDLGTQLSWKDEHAVTIQTEQLTRRVLDQNMVSGAVGMLLFLAPMLVRRQHVRLEVDFPLNRIRTHLDAMRDLGIDVITAHGAVECKLARWDRKDIILDRPSVTATAIVMMLAASLGKHTIIRNTASEPHMQALGRALDEMGASVSGLGSGVVEIQGADLLNGFDTTIEPDHIEATSIAAIAAMSGGRVSIEPNDPFPDMRLITRTFKRLGIAVDADADMILVPKHDRLTLANREEDVDASIETAPWPGFPSDLVSVATVAATQAAGTSLIHETLFKDRLLFVDTLKDMGANIILADPHRAIVVGGTPLQGTYIAAPDARFGLGLLAAALVAKTESVIDNAEGFDYTFDGILQKLRGLDAQISTGER